MPKPRMPKGYGSAAKTLWTSVVNCYELDESPDKVAILDAACRVQDTIFSLEKAMVGEPLVVRGSAGQLVSHPNISEARAQRSLLINALKSLNFSDES